MIDFSSQKLRDLALLTLIGLLAFLPGLASLPPIDRDESRYMQATVQMVETGDLIDIRFQDDARHKKPAGAYWAQLASLGLTGQIDDLKRGERAVWAHRLPSVLGALIAVWATYLAGLTLMGRREALLGAGLLAVSVSLVFEAHIAKTDAMLAGACAVILYGIVSRKAWPVWLALSAGILLKGPVILSVAGLALITDGLWNRSASRVRPVLKPLPILTALAITLPWFIAIGLQTDGAFYAEALGRDFGGKLASAQETHGGAPGYYALTTLFMFWPGVLALPVAALMAWKNRDQASIRFLLAWIIPMWILLEFIPTKLPHYTLPLYPALALLAGAAWVRVADARKTRWGGIALGALTAILLSALVTGTVFQDMPIFPVILIGLFLIASSLGGLFLLSRGRTELGLLLCAMFLASGFGGVLSNSPLFDLSPRLVAEHQSGQRIVSPDYREPSLVFLAGTDTRLTREAAPGDTLILGEYSDPPVCAKAMTTVNGMNYAKGQELSLTLYNTDACSARALQRWANSVS